MNIDPLFDVTGRVMLITGASSGLGAAFAELLAARGARVVIGARRADRLERVAAQIRAADGSVETSPLDVTDPASIQATFDCAEARFGPVEVIVNNAGIVHLDPLTDITDADWDRELQTNLTGVHRVAREAARRLIKRGQGGSIINMSSMLGIGTYPGLGAYMTTKAAVIQLTRAQALEWGPHGIRANALAPGFFPSEMTEDFLDSPPGRATIQRVPIGRTGRLEELAGPLLLLASAASTYMNGSVVMVDGGHLCGSL